MEPFFITIQIILAILLPVILVFALKITLELIQERREFHEYQTRELEKYHVFDNKAEFYKVPNPTMIGVRLKKSGKVVWEGGIDREGIER